MEKNKEFYDNVDEFLKSKFAKKMQNINCVHKNKIKKIIREHTKKTIRNNIITIENFVDYNVPGDWSKRLFKIKNDFKRDSSSKESFKIRFGNDIGLEKFTEKTNKTTVTLDSLIKKHGKINGQRKYEQIKKRKISIGKKVMIKKYGKEIGNKKWESYLTKWKSSIKKRKSEGNWKNGLTLNELINKYGEVEGYDFWKKLSDKQKYMHSKQFYVDKYGELKGGEKWKKYCKKRDYTSLKYFQKKYGIVEGEIKYKERCKNISYYNSLEYFIIKYGEEDGKKRKEDAIKKSFLNHKYSITRYSKISQELFWEVYSLLGDNEKVNCYFAELNQEWIFYIHQDDIKIIMVDFKMGNKIVEFYGDYWHSKPSQIVLDEKKENILKAKGYEIFLVLEKDYKKNKQKIIKETINFLKK